MKALVTGGTGFVGGHLCEQLLVRGHEVTVLARNPASAEWLARLGVIIVQGDIAESASVNAAVAEQEVVFHCAALASDWGPKQSFVRTNVGGAEAVGRACLTHKVRRLVHLSTDDVHDPYIPKRGADESFPFAVHPRDPYVATKLEAEQILWQLRREEGLPLTVFRPIWIWGPRDPFVNRWLDALRSPIFAWPDGGRNINPTLHVLDLVRAMITAAEVPMAEGEAYVVTSGKKDTSREFLETLAAKHGVRTTKREVRLSVLLKAATMFEATWGLVKAQNPPPLTRLGLTYFVEKDWNIGKARNALDLEPWATAK